MASGAMADESGEKDEAPSEAEGDKLSSSFTLAPFSRISASWVTLGDLIRLEEGEISGADMLREECERQGQSPPSDEEIQAFTASLEEVQQESSNLAAQVAKQLGPKMRLAEQLGAKIPRLPPIFDAGLLESVSKAREGLQSMASVAREFDQPQPFALAPSTGQVTVEALARLQAELSGQEELTNTILEKLASNAEDTLREQNLWNRRYFKVAVATLVCALAALIVGIISLAA